MKTILFLPPLFKAQLQPKTQTLGSLLRAVQSVRVSVKCCRWLSWSRVPLTVVFLLAAPSASHADVLYVAAGNQIMQYDLTTGAYLGLFANASVASVWAMAFDSGANLFVANSGNNTIWKFTPDGSGSLFATNGLNAPRGLAIDGAGNLFVANSGNNSIWKFTPAGSGSLFASNGLNQPYGLAFDSRGNLFVANVGSSTILKFTPAGNGSLFASGGTDPPLELAFDSKGNLYGNGAQTIWEFTPDGGSSVLWGPAGYGFRGFAVDSADNLYVGQMWDFHGIFKLAPGQFPYVFASGFAFPPAALAVRISPSAPPSITSGPQPQTVHAGDTASFTVTATNLPLYYQWSLNGTNIPGANWSSLAVPNVKQANLGIYTVVVSNLLGTVSSNAVLSMYPYLARPFAGLVTDWGFTNTLNVGAWGTGPLSYQWYHDGVAIADATNDTLTLSSIQFTNAGLYSVIVSNSLGSVTNPPAQVVVNAAGVSLGFCPSLIIDGVVGYSYVIDRTADLANTNAWVTLTNLTLTQPMQLWVDTNVNASSPFNSKYFYRVLPGR